MTPKEIKEMNSYLTRKDTKTPEQRAKINKQNNLKEKQRLLDKRKGYGINDNNYLESEINKLTKELSEDKITTKQRTPVKADNYIYDGSKGTIRSEREITEEEINKDPNILRRIKYYTETYDNVSLGKDYDAAIAAEDKNLKALGRNPVNLYERGKKTAALKSRLNNSRAYGYDPKDPKNIRAERAFKAKQIKAKDQQEVELPKPIIPSFPLDYSVFNKPEPNPEMIAAENNFKKMLAETEAKKNRLEGLEAIIGVKADDIKNF